MAKLNKNSLMTKLKILEEKFNRWIVSARLPAWATT
jgi:hypothetical protein